MSASGPSPAATRFRKCGETTCARRHGHKGECRPTYYPVELCGAWMPYARTTCARRRGHGDTCRSRYALDNWRDARWFGVAS